LFASALFLLAADGSKDEATKVRLEHQAWVEKCLGDFETIKLGMTRGEVEKRFPADGGLQTVSPVRFAHPECGYFKINVEFSFERDESDQGRAVASADDPVTKVSKPYIERPFMD